VMEDGWRVILWDDDRSGSILLFFSAHTILSCFCSALPVPFSMMKVGRVIIV